MTPATRLLKKQQADFSVHEYQHDKNSVSYGLEAAEKLALDAQQVFKTLVVALDSGELVVAMLPVAEKLNMKAIAKTFGAKKAQMADKQDVLRSTGYVLGGVSPLGQKKRLKTVIHESAFEQTDIFVSAGKRGLEIELAPELLQKLLQAKSHPICV